MGPTPIWKEIYRILPLFTHLNCITFSHFSFVLGCAPPRSPASHRDESRHEWRTSTRKGIKAGERATLIQMKLKQRIGYLDSGSQEKNSPKLTHGQENAYSSIYCKFDTDSNEIDESELRDDKHNSHQTETKHEIQDRCPDRMAFIIIFYSSKVPSFTVLLRAKSDLVRLVDPEALEGIPSIPIDGSTDRNRSLSGRSC
jgi:hypothetical protein